MSLIRLFKVDLGKNIVKIPVAELGSSGKGKTLLVTAGMDGDEYASIDAAYKLIEHNEDKKINGRLVIIPIVNILGFENATSFNPQDGKYPKHLFPGKKSGSSTSRLMYWLKTIYVDNCDVWIDLHGGSLTETLNPFVYFPKTKNLKLKDETNQIIKRLNISKIVHDKVSLWSYKYLEGKGIIHIISEAGYGGKREKKMIDYHLNLVTNIMNTLEMIIRKTSKIDQKKRIYTQIKSFKAKKRGLWYPRVDKDSYIHIEQKLGEVKSLDGKILQTVTSQVEGEYLWVKQAQNVAKNDVLLDVCFDRKNLVY